MLSGNHRISLLSSRFGAVQTQQKERKAIDPAATGLTISTNGALVRLQEPRRRPKHVYPDSGIEAGNPWFGGGVRSIQKGYFDPFRAFYSFVLGRVACFVTPGRHCCACSLQKMWRQLTSTPCATGNGSPAPTSLMTRPQQSLPCGKLHVSGA